MANFTPQEIEDFLQEFFDVVGTRQYTGARYVPIFGRAGEDTVEWDDSAPYEPLTVVMNDGVSYVSRRYVPAGIQITDTDYWVQTYRFNAQVQQYFDQTRRQINELTNHVDEVDTQLQGSKVPYPVPPESKFGTDGQVLSSHGDGTTEWVDPLTIDEETAGPVIDAWLDAHPEATTTIQDGAVTTAKIADGAVTDAKLAAGGIKSDIANLEGELSSIVRKGITFVEALSVTKGYYDGTGFHNSSQFRTITFACSVGDMFHVRGYSQYTSRWLATFFDTNDDVLGHVNYPVTTDYEADVPITVAGTVKVAFTSQTNIVTTDRFAAYKYTNDHPPTRYLELADANKTTVSDYWWYSGNDTIVSRSGATLYVVPCEAGERYQVKTYCGFNEMAAGAIGFASTVGDPIGSNMCSFNLIAGSNQAWVTKDLTVPSGANFMLVNTSYVTGTYVMKYVNKNLITLAESTKRNKVARFCYDSSLGYMYRYKYTNGLDCAYRFRFAGTNRNFGLINIAHITNTDELVKDQFNDFTTQNNFYTLQSEWLSPYGNLKAVNNADGDYTSGFTGGSHTLGDNVATMSNESMDVYLDGKLLDVTEHTIYDCDTLEFVVSNLIQACNTVKDNGTGRAVVRERQHIIVTPDTMDIYLDITFLEECTLDSYYFAQQEIYSWADRMWFVTDPNKLAAFQGTIPANYDGSIKSESIISGWKMFDDAEWTECVVDNVYGAGNRCLIQSDTPTAIARDYGKFYSWLIDDQHFYTGDTISAHCTYRFWNQE